MRFKRVLGGVSGGVASITTFVLYIVGGLIYLWSVLIALGEKGFISCAITFFTPILSQIYWFFYCNGKYGGILNTYSLAIIIYIVAWIIVIGLAVVASWGLDSESEETTIEQDTK